MGAKELVVGQLCYVALCVSEALSIYSNGDSALAFSLLGKLFYPYCFGQLTGVVFLRQK